jgi:protein involved in polysaccharide export with SLBB domain
VRYLLLGDNAANPYLSDGDVVYVPPRSEMVHVYGSVYREGGYEFIEGETLAEVIGLAGGLRPEAFPDSIEVQRFAVSDPSVSQAMYPSAAGPSLADFKVAGGDRVFVRAVDGWHEDAKVIVSGEVAHPGVYVIEEGSETLRSLLARAGGLTERASLAEARLVRGSYASIRYPIEDGIQAASDLEQTLSDKDAQLAQTLGREPKGALALFFEEVFAPEGGGLDPLVYGGDVIEVPRSSESVRVSGQVKHPGLVAYQPGKPYSHYIRSAGGFASGADLGGIRVVTGQMLGVGGAEVRPGDIIWVPRKSDRSFWQAVKDVVTVLAQAATIYIVVDQITSE